MAAKKARKRKRPRKPKAEGFTLAQAAVLLSQHLPATTATLDAIVPVAKQALDALTSRLDDTVAREIQARLTGAGRRG